MKKSKEIRKEMHKTRAEDKENDDQENIYSFSREKSR